MLLCAQFPLADVRPFLTVETHRLPRPETFVRRAGGPSDRAGGPPPDNVWPAEGDFWTAKRTLRFDDALHARRLGEWERARFMGAFRRLFWTPDTLPRARFELGISNSPRGRYRDGHPFAKRPDFGGEQCAAALADFLSLPVEIATHGVMRQHALASADRPLARLLLDSTTRWGDATASAPERWWVSACGGACVVEYGVHERGEPPPGAVSVADEREAFALTHYRFRRNQRTWPVWLVEVREPASRDVRLIRLHVLRLHAELETFGTVLKHLGDEDRQAAFATTGPRSALLDRYLESAMKLLSEPSKYGGSQDRLVDAALRYRTVVDPDEHARLSDRIERAALFRPLLSELLDQSHPARQKLEAGVQADYPDLPAL